MNPSEHWGRRHRSREERHQWRQQQADIWSRAQSERDEQAHAYWDQEGQEWKDYFGDQLYRHPGATIQNSAQGISASSSASQAGSSYRSDTSFRQGVESSRIGSRTVLPDSDPSFSSLPRASTPWTPQEYPEDGVPESDYEQGRGSSRAVYNPRYAPNALNQPRGPGGRALRHMVQGLPERPHPARHDSPEFASTPERSATSSAYFRIRNGPRTAVSGERGIPGGYLDLPQERNRPPSFPGPDNAPVRVRDFVQESNQYPATHKVGPSMGTLSTASYESMYTSGAGSNEVANACWICKGVLGSCTAPDRNNPSRLCGHKAEVQLIACPADCLFPGGVRPERTPVAPQYKNAKFRCTAYHSHEIETHPKFKDVDYGYVDSDDSDWNAIGT